MRQRFPLLVLAALLLAGCSDGSSSARDVGVDGSGDVDGLIDVAPDLEADVIADLSDDAGGAHFPLRFEELSIDEAPHSITDMLFLPGAADLLVAEQGGTVRHLRLDGDAIETLGTFDVPDVHRVWDCGLISLALDNEFDDTGLLFASYCINDRESRISRLTFDDGDYAGIADSAVEIMTVGANRDRNPIHNVGAIAIDFDGNLLAQFGEKQIPTQAQNLETLLGTLVRVTPSRQDGVGGYTVPETNPFVGDESARDEILAWGLRSPWRGFLDDQGRWWMGDVGNTLREEVNVIETTQATNMGWPNWEGTVCKREGDCGEHQPPVVEYSREADDPFVLDDPFTEPTTQRVVWVGTDYVGVTTDRYAGLLDDKVVYGDLCAGWVRAVEVDEEREVVEDGPIGHLAHAIAWAVGPDDYIYAATFGSCTSSNSEQQVGRFWRAVLAE